MKESPFYPYVVLLLKVLPHIAKEEDFALKGGTAINLFVRNMPRLSVDVDLTYLPIEDRDTSLSKISGSLQRIAKNIQRILSPLALQEIALGGSSHICKLIIRAAGAQIKIEPNLIIRGTVLPCEKRDVVREVQDTFGMFVSMQTLSIPDLYGGKICAALDRQHPRDLFDIKLLLDNEGITEEIRKAFIVYLVSHNRPISELLHPVLRDSSKIYENELLGMTRIPVSHEDLAATSKELVSVIKKSLTKKEKQFLVSFKEGRPDWGMAEIHGIENLPVVQWKLQNIRKMAEAKRQKALNMLKIVLGG